MSARGIIIGGQRGRGYGVAVPGRSIGLKGDKGGSGGTSASSIGSTDRGNKTGGVGSGGKGAPRIEIPKLIDHPQLPYRVMEGEATYGQFRQLYESGYIIEGHNKDLLLRLILDPANASKPAEWVSLEDGKALAIELNRQNPGRRFRVPTSAEWHKAKGLVGSKMTCRYANWVDTEMRKGFYFLHHLTVSQHLIDEERPHWRYDGDSVRLIEDKINN